MEFPFLKMKGQISIEFIIILVIMLIYIQTMIQPMMDASINSTQEVNALGQTRSATEKLVNAVDFVALSASSTKQQIHFYLPANVTLSCNDTGNEFSFSLPFGDDVCNLTRFQNLGCAKENDDAPCICGKTLPVVKERDLVCSNFPLVTYEKGEYFSVSVYKNDDGETHVEA